MIPIDISLIIYEYSTFNDKQNVKNGLDIKDSNILDIINDYKISFTNILGYVKNEREKKTIINKIQSNIFFSNMEPYCSL